MKKNILTLGLLGLAIQTYAQVPSTFQLAPRFTEVNLNNSLTAPSFAVGNVHTVSPSIMWATIYDASGTTAGPTDSFVRTINGTDFDLGFLTSNVPSFSAANIHGITGTTAVASIYSTTVPGGQILRTTNGGRAWLPVTTAAQFAAPGGFNNLVYMANNGLDGFSFGDPNGGSYEVLVTTDGGATWTRNTSAGLVPTDPGEYGLVRSYFGRDRKVWAGGGVQASGGQQGGIARIFRNSNAGQGAWQAATLPAAFRGTPSDIAFRDDLNGIAMNIVVTGGAISGYNLAKTTDGGANWTMVTANGPVYYDGLDAACGKFISYGRSTVNGAPASLATRGYSTSVDGINWTNVQTSIPMISLDVLDNGTNDSGKGFAGYFTNATSGNGGIYRTVSNPNNPPCIALPTRASAVQKALSVYPNPSVNGVFTLDLSSGIKAGTVVTVSDMLGREVYRSELNNASISARSAMVDLSKQKSGVYTLEVRTAEGNAQQKLVIE